MKALAERRARGSSVNLTLLSASSGRCDRAPGKKSARFTRLPSGRQENGAVPLRLGAVDGTSLGASPNEVVSLEEVLRAVAAEIGMGRAIEILEAKHRRLTAILRS